MNPNQIRILMAQDDTIDANGAHHSEENGQFVSAGGSAAPKKRYISSPERKANERSIGFCEAKIHDLKLQLNKANQSVDAWMSRYRIYRDKARRAEADGRDPTADQNMADRYKRNADSVLKSVMRLNDEILENEADIEKLNSFMSSDLFSSYEKAMHSWKVDEIKGLIRDIKAEESVRGKQEDKACEDFSKKQALFRFGKISNDELERARKEEHEAIDRRVEMTSLRHDLEERLAEAKRKAKETPEDKAKLATIHDYVRNHRDFASQKAEERTKAIENALENGNIGTLLADVTSTAEADRKELKARAALLNRYYRTADIYPSDPRVKKTNRLLGGAVRYYEGEAKRKIPHLQGISDDLIAKIQGERAAAKSAGDATKSADLGKLLRMIDSSKKHYF